MQLTANRHAIGYVGADGVGWVRSFEVSRDQAARSFRGRVGAFALRPADVSVEAWVRCAPAAMSSLRLPPTEPWSEQAEHDTRSDFALDPAHVPRPGPCYPEGSTLRSVAESLAGGGMIGVDDPEREEHRIRIARAAAFLPSEYLKEGRQWTLVPDLPDGSTSRSKSQVRERLFRGVFSACESATTIDDGLCDVERFERVAERLNLRFSELTELLDTMNESFRTLDDALNFVQQRYGWNLRGGHSPNYPFRYVYPDMAPGDVVPHVALLFGFRCLDDEGSRVGELLALRFLLRRAFRAGTEVSPWRDGLASIGLEALLDDASEATLTSQLHAMLDPLEGP